MFANLTAKLKDKGSFNSHSIRALETLVFLLSLNCSEITKTDNRPESEVKLC